MDRLTEIMMRVRCAFPKERARYECLVKIFYVKMKELYTGDNEWKKDKQTPKLHTQVDHTVTWFNMYKTMGFGNEQSIEREHRLQTCIKLLLQGITDFETITNVMHRTRAAAQDYEVFKYDREFEHSRERNMSEEVKQRKRAVAEKTQAAKDKAIDELIAKHNLVLLG
jgi:uncharacterized cysteine cluster protein YcgN (CxxCxxCC family)